MPSHTNKRFKKRKHVGKAKVLQFENNLTSSEVRSISPTENSLLTKESSSKKKISTHLIEYDNFKSENEECFHIVSIKFLKIMLSEILVICKQCEGSLSISSDHRVGLRLRIKVQYIECNINVSKYNDSNLDNNKSEINNRLVYGFCCVGKGQQATEVFCGVMNLPTPPNSYRIFV